MFSNPISVSRDIVRKMIMRQPEVSNTMRRFLEKGWITKSKTKILGKRGRPETLFTLLKSKDEIFNEIKTQLEHKLLSMQNLLIQFKKLEI